MSAVVGVTHWRKTIGLRRREAAWQPGRTRVFLVSLTRFKPTDYAHSPRTTDLTIGSLSFFRDRGVPSLRSCSKGRRSDDSKHKERIHKLLRQTAPAETLVFSYLESHGDYRSESGKYSFCAFNDNLSFSWVFDAHRTRLPRNACLLTTDCCYSGGIVELAKSGRLPLPMPA